jgi:hypothetical protein
MGPVSAIPVLMLLVEGPTHFLPAGQPVVVMTEDATPRFEMVPFSPVSVTVHELAGGSARIAIQGPVKGSGWVEAASLRTWVRRPTDLWTTPRRTSLVATLLPGAVVAEEERFGRFSRVRYQDPEGQVEVTGWVGIEALTGTPPRPVEADPPGGPFWAARRPTALLLSPEGEPVARLGAATRVWLDARRTERMVGAVVARPGLLLRGWLQSTDLELGQTGSPGRRAHVHGFGEIPVGDVLLTLDADAEVRASPDGPILVSLPAGVLVEQIDRDAWEEWLNVRTLHEVCLYGWIRVSDVVPVVP